MLNEAARWSTWRSDRGHDLAWVCTCTHSRARPGRELHIWFPVTVPGAVWGMELSGIETSTLGKLVRLA